jgi:hypothetical protein
MDLKNVKLYARSGYSTHKVEATSDESRNNLKGHTFLAFSLDTNTGGNLSNCRIFYRNRCHFCSVVMQNICAYIVRLSINKFETRFIFNKGSYEQLRNRTHYTYNSVTSWNGLDLHHRSWG